MQHIIFLFLLINLAFTDASYQHSGEINAGMNPATKMTTGSYCNARFDFCIEYPGEVFVNEMIADNGDGVFLSSEGNELTMSVYGEYNVLNNSLEQQYHFLLKSLLHTDGIIEDHLSVFGEDHFVCELQLPAKRIEIRCKKYTDYFVTMIIRVNNPEGLELTSLKDDINLTVSM